MEPPENPDKPFFKVSDIPEAFHPANINFSPSNEVNWLLCRSNNHYA